MDDFRLKVFITAARTLSFTRTAERLFISQPAVSKHIGELESQYKVQLFMRRGSRLELTGAGETLLACAERLADDYRRMQYEMSLCADAPVGELRLGASTTIAQYLLPPILARFTTRFPGVRVAMMSGNSDQVEQALGGHGIDLGMVESLSRRQGLHYTVFAPDELVLVARTGGPYSRTESITADELREIPLVLREGGSGTLEVIKAALGRAGIRIPQLNVVMLDRGDQGFRPQQRRHGHRFGDLGRGRAAQRRAADHRPRRPSPAARFRVRARRSRAVGSRPAVHRVRKGRPLTGRAFWRSLDERICHDSFAVSAVISAAFPQPLFLPLFLPPFPPCSRCGSGLRFLPSLCRRFRGTICPLVFFSITFCYGI